jgi:hypothetical protein
VLFLFLFFFKKKLQIAGLHSKISPEQHGFLRATEMSKAQKESRASASRASASRASEDLLTTGFSGGFGGFGGFGAHQVFKSEILEVVRRFDILN